MKYHPLKFVLFCVLSVFAVLAHAQHAIPERAWVADPDNLLTQQAKEDAATTAKTLSSNTGAVVGAVVIESLQGETIEQFAGRVAETWHLGVAGDDRGAIFVLAVKERKVRIETSRAISATLTDSRANQIIGQMKSLLKGGDWGAAVNHFFILVQPYVGQRPEVVAQQQKEQSEAEAAFGKWILIVICTFAVIAVTAGIFIWWREQKEEEKREKERREAHVRWLAQDELNRLERQRRREAEARNPPPPPPRRDPIVNPHAVSAEDLHTKTLTPRPAPKPRAVPLPPPPRRAEPKPKDDDDSGLMTGLAAGLAIAAVASSSRKRDSDDSPSWTSSSSPSRSDDGPSFSSGGGGYDGGGASGDF